MIIVTKITQQNKTRIVTICPSPLVLPFRFGEEKENEVIVPAISNLRLEYDDGKILMTPSSSVYRLDGLVEAKINPGIKIVLQEKNAFRVGETTFEFTIDHLRGDFLAQNPSVRHILEEKYGKVWLVGFGGIASVYAAENQEKALKVLAKGYSDPKIVQRFVLSGEKIKPLDHLGLLKIGQTFSEPEKNLYYTEMEYCPGVTLSELISRKGVLKYGQSFSLIRQLAEVIAYISSQGIVHRDINPKNLLVDEMLCLKLLGVTLVKSADSDLTQKGTTMFTPNFSAPEQIEEAANVDEKADVFSLGAVAYYLLSGEPPFGARNHSEYLKIITRKTPPVPLPQGDRQLLPDICELVHKALAFEREKRPSIQHFFSEYQKILKAIKAQETRGFTAAQIRESGEPILRDFLETREIRQLGRFQIEKEIGQGGLGRVYKAYDTKLERMVALKLLRRGTFANEDEMNRFHEEARIVGQLQHPNICRLYESGTEKAQPYMVMEFIEGEPLSPWAQKMSPREIAQKIKEIADVLEYAHSKHIIHRDIKPSNIMIRQENQPVLLDFGMARDVQRESRLTRSGTFVGTLAYASPEQIKQEIPAPTMDVYSLGVVLYELLTGQLPFSEEPVKMLHMIRKGDPPAPPLPSVLNRNVAQDLENIVLCAINFDSNRRYQSPKEMAEDIGLFLQGEIIKAKPAGRLKKIRYWAKKRWYYMAPAMVALFLLVGSVVAGLAYERGAKREKARLDLERGMEMSNAFPGENPRKNYREARNFIESARTLFPHDRKILEALFNLHLSYGNWALKNDQIELAEDSLFSLKGLLFSSPKFREFEKNLDEMVELEKQRKSLLDWEQEGSLRLHAANSLQGDRSEKTLEAFKKAQNDPEDAVRETVSKILEKNWGIRSVSFEKNGNSDREVEEQQAQMEDRTYSIGRMLEHGERGDFPLLPLALALLNDPGNRPEKKWISDLVTLLLERKEQTALELVEILGNGEGILRTQAISLSASLKDAYISPIVIPSLIRLLGSSQGETREKVSFALGQIGEFDVKRVVRELENRKNLDTVPTILTRIGPPALPELVNCLRNPVAEIRDVAFGIIEKMDSKAVPWLVKELNNPNLGLRYKIVRLIESFGVKTLPLLLQEIESKDRTIQEKIVEIVGSMGPAASEAESRLIPFLKSPSPSLRHRTLLTLFAISSEKDLFSIVLERLSDEDPKVKLASVSYLGRMGKRAQMAVPHLEKILAQSLTGHEEENIQEQAMIALGEIGPPAARVVPLLKNLFSIAGWRIGYRIACTVLQIEHPEESELNDVASSLCDVAPEIRYEAIQHIPRLPFSSICFLAATKDPDQRVCSFAIEVIGKHYRNSESVPYLVQCLSHSSAKVREKAIQAIAAMKEFASPAIPPLVRCFEDTDNDVRYAALVAISKIASPNLEIVRGMLRSLEGGNPKTHGKIVESLRNISPLPEEWMSGILGSLDSKSTAVKREALFLLGEMREKAAQASAHLLRLFPSSTPDEQGMLREALGKIGTLPIPEARECLAHPSYLVRMETLKMLSEMKSGGHELWQDILPLFEYPDPQLFAYVKRALERIEYPREPSHIRSFLQSSNLNMRIYALKAVSKLGAKAKIPDETLIRLLQDEYPEVREDAYLALAALSPKGVERLIEMMRTEKNEALAFRIARSSGRISAEHLLPILIREIKNVAENDKRYQDRLAIAIVSVGPCALKPLMEIFEGSDEMQRRKAARVILYMGKSAIPSLLQSSRNPNWEVRRYCAWTVGSLAASLGEEARKKGQNLDEEMGEVVKQIPSFFKDAKAEVRLEAVKAAGKIGGYISAPHLFADGLMELLNKKEPQLVRETTANVLQQIRRDIPPGHPSSGKIEIALRREGFRP